MSSLRNKSEILRDAAKLLHDKGLYPAVAHSAYYCCYQLLKHIWLYSMRKTENELNIGISTSRHGSHGYLINETIFYIENSEKKDCENHARDIRNKITRLKQFRINADYADSVFDALRSSKSIYLSDEIIPILKNTDL